jgi:hypothetical protein
MNRLAAFFLILACMSSALQAAEEREGTVQTFRLDTAGLPFSVGAERRLTRVEGETWQLELVASNLLGTIRETSRFTWAGCVPRSLEYRYVREGLGRKREAVVRLDRAAGLARVQHSRRGELEYPIGPDTTDKLAVSLGLQCRLREGGPLVFQVAEEKRHSEQRFVIEGEEVLETPAGRLRTVRVRRDRGEDSERQTYLWFAVERDYALVRLVQEEDGKRHELIIESM